MLEDMVQKKRQDCEFNGFHVPFVPRAPRSARRGLHKRKLDDSQICAFDLLASIAGKLLQESESSSASSNASQTNDHHPIGDDVVKSEQHENVFAPPIASSGGDQKCILEKSLQAESDSILEHSSAITNSDSSEKVCSDLKSTFCKSKISSPSFHCKEEGGSPVPGDYKDCSLKDSVNSCTKFPELINSDANVELPSHRDSIPNASIIRLRRNDSKLGIRDDDENFSRYNKPRSYRYPSRVGERRLRKLLASKCWKVSPKLKDSDLPKATCFEGVRPFYRKRKICYGRERYPHASLYKRRKFSENSLVVNSDGVLSCESVCNSPQNGMKAHKSCSENGAFSSVKVHQPSSQSEDSHVKFSIKSFRIPELFIEVPENATVGSLKRTVMETVTAILGGGLRVGVLLHGKKIRDDNRTLSQTGITSEENLDTLGFTLEPCTVQLPPPVSIEASPVPISHDNSQLVLRPAAAPVSTDLPPPPNSESNKKLLPSSPGKTMADSRALVAVPPVSSEALAVVPVNQKARRSELVQRRTRRPFSVTEVEALVEAVEELGTGRWRDVKLRSFENADHRTYVDLKDKWKTLVHTAKIAPQQRRGEPVPQELLDRVLAAHAYWLQHNNSKNQAAVMKTTEARNGVEGI